MEDRMESRNYEMLGRFLDGEATSEDMASIRSGLNASLCELLLVSMKAMSFISNEE